MKVKHNTLFISFGNEDRMESGEFYFSTPQECALFLERLASVIETFRDSKHYRSSEKSIFSAFKKEYLNSLSKINED